jgi:tetrahydromethanopterin S-methyltransferase subunit G
LTPPNDTDSPGNSGLDRGRMPAPTPYAEANYSRLEEKLTSLATTVGQWERELEQAASHSSRLEGAFTVLLSSLEGWKSDMREVASRTESRVLRGLEVIDSRISRVQPAASVLNEGEILSAITNLEHAISERMATLELDVSRAREAAALPAGLDTLDDRLQGIEEKVRSSDTQLAGRLGASFEILERRLNSIEQRIATPDTSLPDRLEVSIDQLAQRLQTIEQKVSTPDTELPNRIGESFQALQTRLQAIEQKVSEPDKEMPGRLASSMEVLERRLNAIDERLATPDTTLPERLGKGLALLEGRLNDIDNRLSAPDPLPDRISGNFEALERHLRVVDQKVSTPDTEMQDRIAESFQQLEQRLSGIEETLSNPDTEMPAGIAESLGSLERKLAEGQAALTSKLEHVSAEGDENSATQLRYLGSLEELQASVAKRLNALEAIVKNPLDEQQWERLAKGLEFLDVRLAQSLDSVSSKLDNAISSLTATLDARAASGQEANLKSAERLWRALRGLEDQITGSYQLVRQSQERLEASSSNVTAALEELRAVHGARAGHTEKLVMEGLENLDSRFAQNLQNVSEKLGSAIFALNKATEEWRADLANSTEESEERLVGRVGQAESKLSKDLKTGLESLGRREERLLALILGGGASAVPVTDEVPKPPE